MLHDHLVAPPALTLEEALAALEATTDRCALLDATGKIDRTNVAWERSSRRTDPLAQLTAEVGDDFVAACGRAALHGNRDAGSLHAQIRAVLAGTVERAQLTFVVCTSGGETEECRTVVERVGSGEARYVLVSFSEIDSGDAQWTTVPEAGFSIPTGAPFTQLAAALDTIETHAVILDARARIAAVNMAWRRFAGRHGGTTEKTGLGVNYLTVCRKAADANDQRARNFYHGLVSVLRGERDAYTDDSRMSHGGEARRFRSRATSMALAEGRFTLVTHTDVTESVPQKALAA